MRFRIVNHNCPICGSDKVRSKVEDSHGWWYVCDNHEPGQHVLGMPEGHDLDLDENKKEHPEAIRRFYFQPDKKMLEVPGVKTVLGYQIVEV